MSILPKPLHCAYLTFTKSMAAFNLHLSIFQKMLLGPSFSVTSCDHPGNFPSHHALPYCILEYGVFFLSGPHPPHFCNASFLCWPTVLLPNVCSYLPILWEVEVILPELSSCANPISALCHLFHLYCLGVLFSLAYSPLSLWVHSGTHCQICNTFFGPTRTQLSEMKMFFLLILTRIRISWWL